MTAILPLAPDSGMGPQGCLASYSQTGKGAKQKVVGQLDQPAWRQTLCRKIRRPVGTHTLPASMVSLPVGTARLPVSTTGLPVGTNRLTVSKQNFRNAEHATKHSANDHSARQNFRKVWRWLDQQRGQVAEQQALCRQFCTMSD